MSTITKTDLVAAVSEKTGKTKSDVNKIITSVLATIEDEVAAGNKVRIIGFGSFETRKRAKRNGRNPSTGEIMELPETVVPGFKAGNTFKFAVKHEHYKS